MSESSPSQFAVPFDQVIDLLLDAVVIVEPDGRYAYVSAAFERIFGYAPEEVVGRQMLHLVHPDDREKTLAAVAEIMAGQDKTQLENRYIRKDGEVVHIMWSARWVPEHGVRIAVARDVSARRRAEATQAAVYAISEAANDGGSLESLCRTIHQVLGGLLPAGNCSLALCNDRGGLLEFPYHVDERGAAPSPRPVAASGYAGEVIRSGRSLLLGPARLAEPEAANDDEIRGARYWLGVPLKGERGVVIGALAVKSYAEEMRFNARDVLLLNFVSTQVANAIERRRLSARSRMR
jgi:PAS domain S-box-containing protein